MFSEREKREGERHSEQAEREREREAGERRGEKDRPTRTDTGLGGRRFRFWVFLVTPFF